MHWQQHPAALKSFIIFVNKLPYVLQWFGILLISYL